MISPLTLLLFSLGYVGLLFYVAIRADRNRAKPLAPWVYGLAVGVYCTSWTFYGAVKVASESGWAFAAIYLGPILSFLLFWQVFKKIGVLVENQGISSIADFIATRYGKAQGVAILVTGASVLVVIPYIALQLKAINTAWFTLAPDTGSAADPALIATLLLTIFAIAFGTANLSRREHHRGMMLSLAVESVVKLTAFMAVSIMTATHFFGDFGNLMNAASTAAKTQPLFETDFTAPLFLTQTVLAGLAIFCLPRQFQISFIEAGGVQRTSLARWLMPLYLSLFALMVLPIAATGSLTLDPNIDPEVYVLALPLAADMPNLALFAYLGGLSAGVGMVLAATLALSAMICNEWIIPYLVSRQRLGDDDLTGTFLASRRWSIVAIMFLALAYYELSADSETLAAMGLLAFVGAAQFAPALLIGLYWRGANRVGAYAGLSVGLAVWLYSLVIPEVLDFTLGEAMAWHDRLGLVGLGYLDAITHATLWSLGLNLVAFALGSLLKQPNFADRMQATVMVDSSEVAAVPRAWRGQLTNADLEVLLARYLGEQRAHQTWVEIAQETGENLSRTNAQASQAVMELAERRLAERVGASSARLVIDSRVRGRTVKTDELVSVVEETNRALQSSREQLSAALENLAPGVSVIDSDKRLVAWNKRYQEIFDYPEELLVIGTPIADLIAHNAERNFFGDGDRKAQVQRRMRALEFGRSHRRISFLPNGTVIEISGNPMPGGGFVTSFYDITELKQKEAELERSESNIRLYTDTLPVMLAYLDNERRVLFVNQAFERNLGMDRDYILGKQAHEIFSDAEYRLRSPYMTRALEGRQQVFEVALKLEERDALFEATYVPHKDPEGRTMGLFVMYLDITEQRETQIALREANETLEERVTDRTQELQALNRQLMQENEIRAKAEVQLFEAKAQAETANLSKTRFLAAASHDLMQPLNAARLFAGALQQQLAGHSLDLARKLDASLDNAEDLLGTLLEISKLDAGATRAQIGAVHLKPLMEQLASEFSAMSAEKNLELRAVPVDLWVEADPIMLRRVLQNFLSNALRYTRQGKVLLGARRQGPQVMLQVHDTGVGIGEADRQRVFDEFARLESGRAQHDKGMGLGLAITHRLARLLGTQIELSSQENRGSCFGIRLPLTEARADVVKERPMRGRQKARLQGLKVLVVDNEEMILDGMEQLLGDWGCEVWLSESAYDAIRVLEEMGPPDLMVLDYHLDNNATGLEALETFKKVLPEVPPVVLLTADRTEETLDAATKAGARVMNKPIKPAALRALMSGMVKPA